MDSLAPGATSATAIETPAVAKATALLLSEGQVIKATVLRLLEDQVWLNIAGRTITARTEIPLQPQQQVLLAVSQADPDQILLRVLNPLPPSRPASPTAAAGGGGITPGPLTAETLAHQLHNLLSGWGIEPDETNLTIARALLAQQQHLTPEEVRTVRALWRAASPPQTPLTGEALRAGIEPLVFLHTRQLPVGPESLALAGRWLAGPQRVAAQLADLQQVMGEALAQLNRGGAAGPDLDPVRHALLSARAHVAAWSIPAGPDAPAGEIAARLPAVVIGLGTPPEAELGRRLASSPPADSPPAPPAGDGSQAAAGARTPSQPDAAGSLPRPAAPAPAAPPADPATALHRLAAVVAGALARPDLDEPTARILGRLADGLDRATQELGALHLSNLGHPPDAAAEPYYLFAIPLATADGPRTAQLKVFRPAGRRAIDPDDVRLALLLDLPGLGEIAVSLTVFNSHLSGQILSGRAQTQQLVETDLDRLRQGLRDLGYRVGALTSGSLAAGTEAAATPSPALSLSDGGAPLPQIDLSI